MAKTLLVLLFREAKAPNLEEQDKVNRLELPVKEGAGR
jgi:hypothetical protein